LPSGTGFCTTSLILDSSTFIVGCGGWYGGTPGIYRSTDKGAHWTKVSDSGVAGQPLHASDGAIYWAGHQGGALYKSTDLGMSWMQVADSSKAAAIAPVELPGGRIAVVASTVNVSSNGGMTWTAVGPNVPFAPNALSYSAARKAFYITHFSCDPQTAVPSDGIMQLGYQ
jgi:photosystem II stability/assembly factor-like uncharacterized protein